MKTKLFNLFVLCFVLNSAISATTYYVRSGIGSDENDGLSVGTAFATLQKVFTIDLQDGDIVDLAGSFDFNNSQGVTKSITIRGNNKVNTIIQGVPGNEGKNCLIIGASSTTPTVIVENITFQNFDYFDNTVNREGGAIEFKGGSLTCRKVNFMNNRAYAGGAMSFGAGGTVLIEDCYFYNNSSKQRTGGVNAHGGAINISTGASITLTIERCLFEGNTSEAQAAALRIRPTGTGASILVQNSTFKGNVTKSNGSDVGTIVIESGTGAPNVIKLINNTIAFNSSEKTNSSAKAGIRIADNAEGEVELINNILYSNYNAAEPATSVSIDVKTAGLKESRNNITDMPVSIFDFEARTVSGKASGNMNSVSSEMLDIASELYLPAGSETKVLLIGDKSVAVNAGFSAGVPFGDQTGYNRDGSPDVGAYEYRNLTTLISNNETGRVVYAQEKGKVRFEKIDKYNFVKVYNLVGKQIKSESLNAEIFEFTAIKGIYLFVFSGNDMSQKIKVFIN